MKKDYIPFIVFFGSWVLIFLSGLGVASEGTTNPFADPFYSYIWWLLAANGRIEHPYFWYYLIFGFQHSGALPLQGGTFLILAFVINAPLIIVCIQYFRKVRQED